MVRTKMLAVCVNSDVENRVESVLEILLAELADDKHEKFDLIQRCNLDTFLWAKLDAQFGYKSKTPGMRHFAIGLFKACYAQSLEEKSVLTQDALVFLKRWRDSIRYQNAFEKLSEECVDILGIKNDLENRDFRKPGGCGFLQVGRALKILDSLAAQIFNRTLSAGDCATYIWSRRSTHWYKHFTDTYEALYYASQFINEVHSADLRMDSLSDGIHRSKYLGTSGSVLPQIHSPHPRLTTASA